VKAVTISRFGGPEVLEIGEVEEPVAGPGEILVDVAAAGVNQADMTARAGRYLERTPVPGVHFYPLKTFPGVLGVELSGTVAALGPGVTQWKIGDRVCGIGATGAYAEKARMMAWAAMPVPEGISLVEAASIPIAFLTVWIAFRELADVRRGDTVLVQAVGAGVGQAAVQFTHLLGARVLGTEISDEKLEKAAGIGLDAGCNAARQDFVAWVMEQTNGVGVDAIIDTLGAAVFNQNLAALSKEGRLVCLSTATGAEPTIELGRIIGNHLKVYGMSTAAMMTPDRIRRFSREVLSVMPGQLRPVIDSTYSLSDAADAHRYLAGAAHFGKIVLTTGA
jgi:NADPH:quinone reductase-like Zn-dependent oxidoreductase